MRKFKICEKQKKQKTQKIAQFSTQFLLARLQFCLHEKKLCAKRAMWDDEEDFSDEYDSGDECEVEYEDDEEANEKDSVAELLLECEEYSIPNVSNMAKERNVCCVGNTNVLLWNMKYVNCSEIRKGDQLWTQCGALEVLCVVCVPNCILNTYQTHGFCGSAMISADGESWVHVSEVAGRSENKGICNKTSPSVRGDEVAQLYFILTIEEKFVIFNGEYYVEIDNSHVHVDNAMEIGTVNVHHSVNGCVTSVHISNR